MIINQIVKGGGTTPTGTISITSNGTYDVADKASADVQVPTTAPELYRVFRNNNGKLANSISTPFLPLPNTITDIADHALAYAYSGTLSSVLSGAIDLSSLTTLSGSYACYYMFYGCNGLTSVDLSSLTTVSGSYACEYMFYDCTGLTSVDLSSLTTVSGDRACDSMFYGCTGLTSVDLSSLTTVSGSYACDSMFYGCTNLTSISFPALREILPATTHTQFDNMFSFCESLTEIHFPSNMQTRISAMSGYSSNFGATNATIYFDLPSTEQ